MLDALLPAAHRGGPDYLDPRAEWIEGDVRDPETVAARAVDGVDAVCHQAAMVGLGVDIGDIADYVGHNDLGTAVLLRALAARGFAGRLVLASSMVVYGEGRYALRASTASCAPARGAAETSTPGASSRRARPAARALAPETVPEDAPLDPRNVYAATKLAQEHLCAAFARETGVPVTALRYHNVYGPRMPRDTPYAGVASIFRSALAAGRRAARVRGRRPAARLRARPRRRRAPTCSRSRRRAGHRRVQRRQRHAAHACSRWRARSRARSTARRPSRW